MNEVAQPLDAARSLTSYRCRPKGRTDPKSGADDPLSTPTATSVGARHWEWCGTQWVRSNSHWAPSEKNRVMCILRSVLVSLGMSALQSDAWVMGLCNCGVEVRAGAGL